MKAFVSHIVFVNPEYSKIHQQLQFPMPNFLKQSGDTNPMQSSSRTEKQHQQITRPKGSTGTRKCNSTPSHDHCPPDSTTRSDEQQTKRNDSSAATTDSERKQRTGKLIKIGILEVLQCSKSYYVINEVSPMFRCVITQTQINC